MRLYLLFLFIVGLPVAHSEERFVVVTIADSSFASDETIFIEVIETGDTVNTFYGKPVSCRLPLDTLWNLSIWNSVIDTFVTVHVNDIDSLNNVILGLDLPVLSVLDSLVMSTPDSFSALAIDSLGNNKYIRLEKSQTYPLDSTLVIQTSYSVDSLHLFRTRSPLSNVQIVQSTIDSIESVIALAEDAAEKVRMQKTIVYLKKKIQQAPGVRTLDKKKIKNRPGLFHDDLILALGSQPGVSTVSDLTSKINVRGSASDQNLMMLDKGILYTPFHFFGLFSSFITQSVKKVDWYFGGFPVRYGDRLASVIDVQGDAGRADSSSVVNGGVKLNVFAVQGHLQGTFGPVDWLIAGRKSYFSPVIKLTQKMELHNENIEYGFHDYQGKVRYTFGPEHTLSITYYDGEDLFNYDWLSLAWGNSLTALNYVRKIDRLVWENHLSYTGYHHGINREVSGVKEESSNTIKTIKASTDVHTPTSDKMQWGIGFEGIASKFKFTRGSETYTYTGGFIDSANSVIEHFYHTRSPLYASLYGSVGYKFGVWYPEVGIRSTYHLSLEKPFFEPRINIQMFPSKRQTVQFQTGYYYQFVNSIHFNDYISSAMDNYIPAYKNDESTIPPARELFSSLNYLYTKLFGKLDITLGSFYKSFWNSYMFDVSKLGTDFKIKQEQDLADFIYYSNGYSYGLEASLVLNKAPIAGEISYTYNRTVIKDDLHKYAYYSVWDRTHSAQCNVVINWRGMHGFFTASYNELFVKSSFQIKASTGSPYTALTGYEYVPNSHNNEVKQIFSFGSKNQSKLPGYNRIDLKVFEIGKKNSWKLSYAILNVFNTKNIFVKSHDYFANPPTSENIYQLPIVPIFIDFEWSF
ncbi:MAG: Plug domain-containing protein [Fibrobacterales bacterium]